MNLFKKIINFFSNLPFGVAPTLIIIVFALSSFYLLTHPVRKTNADITFYTFALGHKPAYVKAIAAFESNNPNVKVDMQLVDATAVSRRLQAAFMSDVDVPDMVEVLDDDLGVFFRGPLEDIGFWDISEKIEAEIKNETAKAIISTFMMVLGALWITCTLIISIAAGQRLYEWLLK